MIRGIYRWKVDPERRDDFINAWRIATRSIHAETPGAMGSFCPVNISDTLDELLTVALWRSEEEWRDFIGSAYTGPIAAIHKIGTLISATPYAQLGDETVSIDSS